MLATPGRLPPAREHRTWAFEMKWDGVRAVTYVEGGQVQRLRTRNGREVLRTYPELAAIGEELGPTAAVLDGEIVAVDASGRPSFGTLQRRMHVGSPSRSLLQEVPVTLFLFDLLWLDGASMTARPYDERRALLEVLGLAGPHWQTPPAFQGDGAAAVELSRVRSLEGVIAKRRDAPYDPGQRSRAWLKIKNVRHQDVLVCGWKPGEGRRGGGIGSLLLAVPEGHRLRYVGHVGTGFTAAMLEDIDRRLGPLRRSTAPPFTEPVPAAHARDARWVDPVLVAEVSYSEWTRDGRLRHPVWRGLRADIDPVTITVAPE